MLPLHLNNFAGAARVRKLYGPSSRILAFCGRCSCRSLLAPIRAIVDATLKDMSPRLDEMTPEACTAGACITGCAVATAVHGSLLQPRRNALENRTAPPYNLKTVSA